MNVQTKCPDSSQLRQFVDGVASLDAAEPWNQHSIEQHVNDCEACQHSIEQLAAGQESWELAAKQLAELDAQQTDATCELPELHAILNREFGTARNQPGSLTDIPLDFLQPSDQPDSKGRLGSYEILGVVGRGGMGLVLKAYDSMLRRIVAIKVLSPHAASMPMAKFRFVREARAAAAISHDHVVAIYAVEDSNDPPFLVMQFIRGKTLHERIVASGVLMPAEILRIGMQIAQGLSAAHAQGLVHRDIKPANILLENGVERVKIADFGLARSIEDVRLTQTGVIAGTPQYMAPEQANGEPIDARADLFSLGSVLYMGCTGSPPFRATTTIGLLKRICEETPRSIRASNPDIPDWLEAIIFRLLKKNPDERFQTAKEVADLLANGLAHLQQPIAIPVPMMEPVGVEVEPVSAVVEQAAAIQQPGASASIDRSTANVRQSWIGDISISMPFAGDVERTLDFATTTMAASGFKITERTDERLMLLGPGMNYARGNPLAAASKCEISATSKTLRLSAELGTWRRVYGIMASIMIFGYFPIALINAMMTGRPNIGLFVGPLMGLLMLLAFIGTQRATLRAFKDFFQNLAQEGTGKVGRFTFNKR